MPEGNPQGYANTQASPYQQAWDQFGTMMPPDPNTFIQLIWPFLDVNTRHLVRRLLTNPAAGPAQPGTTVAQPAAAQAATAQSAEAAPAATAAPAGQDPKVQAGGPGGFTVDAAPQKPRAVQFGGRTVNIDSLAPKGSPTNPEGQTNGMQRIFMKDGSQQVADLASGNGVPTPTRIGSQNTQFEVDMGGGVMAYARDAEGLKRLRAASGRQ